MLTAAEQTDCLNELHSAATTADFVVASGSLPPGVHDDYFQRVADVCRDRGAPLVLDTSGAALRHITSGVFMLKPSVRELRECVGREMSTESDQAAAARELIDLEHRERLAMVKVFLVDDHEVVRRGLIDLLAAIPSWRSSARQLSSRRRVGSDTGPATRRRSARCPVTRRQRDRALP